MSHSAAKVGKKIHFSPASPLSVSIYICFKIERFIKKLIRERFWLVVLLLAAQDLCVALEEQSALPTHLCSACSPAPDGEPQFGSAGLELGGMPAGSRQPPGVASAMPAAAAVSHLDET